MIAAADKDKTRDGRLDGRPFVLLQYDASSPFFSSGLARRSRRRDGPPSRVNHRTLPRDVERLAFPLFAREGIQRPPRGAQLPSLVRRHRRERAEPSGAAKTAGGVPSERKIPPAPARDRPRPSARRDAPAPRVPLARVHARASRAHPGETDRRRWSSFAAPRRRRRSRRRGAATNFFLVLDRGVVAPAGGARACCACCSPRAPPPPA